DDGRAGRLGDVERVADVVAVAVREHDVGDALDRRRLVGDKGRVSGEERIDQHRVLAEVEAEGRVAVPGDLHVGLSSEVEPPRTLAYHKGAPTAPDADAAGMAG